MTRTRKSTYAPSAIDRTFFPNEYLNTIDRGKLPTPKRENLADTDDDEEDYLDEYEDKKPSKKQPKIELDVKNVDNESGETRKPARKRVKKWSDDEDYNVRETNEKPANGCVKKESVGDLDIDHVNGGETSASNPASYEIKKSKLSRSDRLITGPTSKSSTSEQNARKSGGSRVRVRKSDTGKLARMMDLPVDVFCEIASYVTTLDLLQLARSTRALRSLLMSKSSRTIWLASEAAMGLPPCPSDMCEPQYASLQFEKFCNACGYPRVERVTHALRVRLCQGCHSLNVVRGSTLAKAEFGAEVAKMYEIYSLLPWNNMYWRPDLQDHRQPSDARWGSRFFLKIDFIEVVGVYLSTEPGSEERKQFVEERHKLLSEVVKNISDMESWRYGEYRRKAEVEAILSQKRSEKILEKLEELGYASAELEEMGRHTKTWIDMLRQPRELTDSRWKILRPQLEELIEKKREIVRRQICDQNRTKRIDELHALFVGFSKDWKQRQGPNYAGHMLCFADLCKVPLVLELIEEKECSVEMTSERWKRIERTLPELIQSHTLLIEMDCASLLLSARQDLQASVSVQEDEASRSLAVAAVSNAKNSHIDRSVLRQASAFFSARVVNSSARVAKSSLFNFENILAERRRLLYDKALVTAWSTVNLLPSKNLVQVTESLLLSLKLSKTTSMDYMVSLNRSFVCRCCSPILRVPMTWRELVAHILEEVEWFQLARRCCAGSVVVLDDHDLENTVPGLAFIKKGFKAPPDDGIIQGV
ncbi:hypothetical protein DFH11DRAFT_1544751 [Phellopilus nigrolimitatus]|nr:hypothetical protein DFH11DRAFT_1544751 [Phellopilus nigrolimitatus]